MKVKLKVVLVGLLEKISHKQIFHCLGIETITAECRRLDDGSPVKDNHCDQRSKPPTQQYPCKEEACPPV